MRVFTKILIVSLLAVAVLTAGCTDPAASSQNEENNIIVCDFEAWAPDFQLIRVMDGFGTITQNTDEKYVKEGEASAKLQPLGNYGAAQNPFFYIPFRSSVFDINLADFTNVSVLYADMYNAEEENIPFRLGFVTEVTSYASVKRTQSVEYLLKPGWNRIEYDVDINFINLYYNITSLEGVFFEFDNRNSRYIEDAPVIYLDEIKLLPRTKPAEERVLPLRLEENEIMDFENIYHQLFIEAYGQRERKPSVLVVSSADVGIPASSGQYMAQVICEAGWETNGAYHGIEIKKEVMQACGLSEIPESEYNSTYLCFDYYNSEDFEFMVTAQIYDENGDNWQPIANLTSHRNWVTARIPLSTIYPDTLRAPGPLQVVFGEFLPAFAPSVEVYFDNFRIEKA